MNRFRFQDVLVVSLALVSLLGFWLFMPSAATDDSNKQPNSYIEKKYTMGGDKVMNINRAQEKGR